jgi:hypothetical protein
VIRKLLLLAVLLVPGFAQAQHVDILAALNPAGTQLVSGTAALSSGTYTVGQSVFGAEFGEDPGLPFLASEPGYNAVSNPTGGLPLPDDAALNFNFKAMSIAANTSNLYYWDGSGAVNFTPATGQSFTASKAGGFSATVSGEANDIAGFTINATDLNGFIHRHLDFQLNGPGGNDPAVGIYLVAQEFTMPGLSAPGVLNSEPFFLVFNNSADEMVHDAAVDWVTTNLAVVPEPAGLALLGLAVLFRRKFTP